MFNQLAGVTYVTDARYTGNNAIIAPASTRIYRPNSRANDQSLTTGDEMTLQLIDQLVAQAKLATPVFRPIVWKGKKYYALVLHTNQVVQLRTNTGTGQWLDIQKAAMTGGLIDDNPIFTGALGVYNGVVLFEDTRVPLGVNSATGAAQANTRRAVFLGAQAGILGFGKGMGESSMDWNEELFDYGNQLGVSAGSIFGFKKTVFNSVDFSTYVLATYTA
jgi:N4-gp56 family major capsid protein